MLVSTLSSSVEASIAGPASLVHSFFSFYTHIKCALTEDLEPSVNTHALISTNMVGSLVVKALAMNAGDPGSNPDQPPLLKVNLGV